MRGQNPFNIELNRSVGMDKTMSHMMDEMARHTETVIIDQLNDFISRGLIIVERGPIQLVADPSKGPDQIQVAYSVELKLKDREYILDLEKRNEILTETIAELTKGRGK